MLRTLMKRDTSDFCKNILPIILGEAPVTEEFQEMAQRFGKAIDDYAKQPLTFDGPSFPMDYVGWDPHDVKNPSGEK